MNEFVSFTLERGLGEIYGPPHFNQTVTFDQQRERGTPL